MKTAASALRKRIRLVTQPENSRGNTRYDMWLGDRLIGKLSRGFDGNVVGSHLDSDMHGLGLGKKMYGEVIRRNPSGLSADPHIVSAPAARVWEGMFKRPGYQVEANPGFIPRDGGRGYQKDPSAPEEVLAQGRGPFSARLPAAAQLSGKEAALAAFGLKRASFDEYLGEVKRQGIGHPQEALKQFQKGQLFKPGKGLIAKTLPRSPGAIAAALAWPIMGSLLQARANPDTGGGELVGDLLGRSAGSLLGGPLGMAGQIGGGMLLAPVGQAVGRAYDADRKRRVASDE